MHYRNLSVFNTSGRGGPAPLGFILVYHNVVENIVRQLAYNARTLYATSLDAHIPSNELLNELYMIKAIEHGKVTDRTKLNLASWTHNSMCTLKVYPDTQYGILFEAWDDETGALYAHEAPVTPEKPSPIIQPNRG